ncbi:CBU_0592 family membrane protein [Chryseosolibacter indicus]|uniref:CBU-0592-like domain-containing protein n=1 Tax=Chryseosolibacter indicus TaxID=2782351 RepID=A0ABS5VXS2_9BACT|nr:hypothetical protein [Chryseosolibacter indicus]MBT1705652.1 hypothetical protein [Chryseosolibacter indicus]
MKNFIEIIGWIGSLEVLVAYALNSYQKIRSDSPWFYFLNLTGGICLVIYTLWKEAFASAFVNIIWVLIAAIAIGKLFITQSEKR